MATATSPLPTPPRSLRATQARKGLAFGKGTIRCEVDDGFYMRRCVEIARKAVGRTSPNPMVGCVIVKDGAVVGEGFHPKAGQPHAEVFALKDAGEAAQNATAYVSLEPCNHYGRTPPCTKALIEAKVKRVVIGMVDPNPIVASKGVERLMESGIDVTVGVEEMLCRKLNEAYIHKMLTGKPFVTTRYKLLKNTELSEEMAKSVMEPGGYYSKLLQENDGVIVSSSSLTTTGFRYSQEANAKQPLLIIISKGKSSALFIPTFPTDMETQAVAFVEKDTIIDHKAESAIKQQGVEVVVMDQVRFSTILEYCASQGMCSVLVDVSDDDLICNGFIGECIDDVQKVFLEAPPDCNESKVSVFKTGSKNLALKAMQSMVVKDCVVVEGYL